MKISLQWLKDYLDLSVGAEEIANKLTFAGFEVEAVNGLGKGLEKVFVGEILERKQHPNADRLSLCSINVGKALSPDGAPLEIVCGAQNIKAGQKIPVATLGAHLPNGLEIKAAKIRGVASSGMLCSLDELKFPKEWQAEDGIYLLDPASTVGTPLATHLGLQDTILEISVTPNRGDALSHIGIARELSALFEVPLKLPKIEGKWQEEGRYKVKVNNAVGADLCAAYHARLVEGVKIAPSPHWLKQKIEAIGLRSINNVVDITSFVMFEMGQPLHAFDADRLTGSAGSPVITVRKAKEGENFLTLGDKQVVLKADDLVIASGSQGQEAVALAGVMGGKNSEVTDKTVNVLLEAADFDRISVRKTGRRLALLTDAGYRFERGVDAEKVTWALDRATELLEQVAGGKGRLKVSAQEKLEIKPVSLRLRHSDIVRILGKAPEQIRVLEILRALGFTTEAAAGEPEVLNVVVPSWRHDVKRTVDLVEEVARIWGFENLEAKLPLGGIGAAEPKDSKRRPYFQIRRTRRHLSSLGFFECLNLGFSSPESLAKLLSEQELANVVPIANPVTNDYSVMKPTLLEGLLNNMQHNFSHKRRDLRLFEVRRSFVAAAGKETDARLATGVEETLRLSIAVSGKEMDDFWDAQAGSIDFFFLKGVLESVFELLDVKGLQYQAKVEQSFLHPGQSATLKIGNRVLGFAGRLHPQVEKTYSFEQPVYVAELDLDQLISDKHKLASFHSYSNFPMVERDFSALVKQEVNSQDIRALVTKVAKPLLKNFHYFDVYKGSRVPEGHVSYAFRLSLGSDDHTLTDQEINSVQEKVMAELQKEFGARFAGLT